MTAPAEATVEPVTGPGGQQSARCRFLLPPTLLRLIVAAAPPWLLPYCGVLGPGASKKLKKPPSFQDLLLSVGERNRRPSRYEAALRLVAEHRNKLGAIVGLAAQRLVRDDDRGSG